MNTETTMYNSSWKIIRQTLCQPQMEDLKYALVEQYGEEDKYRLTGHNAENNIEIIIWSAEDINNKIGSEIIYMSSEYKDIIKAKLFAPPLKEVYNRMKSADPYHYEYQINTDKEWFALLNEYISWSLSENPVRFLEIELENLWLCSSNSYWVNWFSNLEETKSDIAANKRWFFLSTPEEHSEEEKMKWNTDLFAEKLIIIYEEILSTKNEGWEIDLFSNPLVKKYWKPFSYNLSWYWEYYYNRLKKNLNQRWYALISSYDNFYTIWNKNPTKLVIKKDKDLQKNKH